MESKDSNCIYNKTHRLAIYDQRGVFEERNINICITDFCDSLKIKLRDTDEFLLFNYTEKVDLQSFEKMRCAQNLDINFNEFKIDLIEMLQQFEKGELFLKCEVGDRMCCLVFYAKSKIKNIIYLMIDLSITNEREIFLEMNNNLQKLQDVNEKLQRQLSRMQASLCDKSEQIRNLITAKKQMSYNFFNHFKQLETTFNDKINNVESLLLNRITILAKRFLNVLHKIEIIKQESCLKSDSSARLIKSFENLRLESIENKSEINDLKKTNEALHTINHNQEKTIRDLNKNLEEKDKVIVEIRRKNDELLQDLEKSSIVIAKKTETADELAKDLLQANQMLVNFNNHYDVKVKKVEELQNILLSKDKIIKEFGMRSSELLREFDDYKKCYNNETENKYKQELSVANCKIHELEEANRKVNKINALLTDKLNSLNNPFHN